MWLLIYAAARLGGGGMFDQCGYYMTARLGGGGMFGMVTICRCCKTWWRGHV